MKIMDKCKEKLNKIGTFIKENKTEIIFGTITVVSAVGSVVIYKKLHNVESDFDNIDSIAENYYTDKNEVADNLRLIDEKIFTELAPRIEEAIMNDKLENAVIEGCYTLAPVLHKAVTVNVETIHGD